MNLSRKSYIIITLLVLVAIIGLAAYVKSSSIAKQNQLQNAIKLAAENKNIKQLEDNHRLE